MDWLDWGISPEKCIILHQGDLLSSCKFHVVEKGRFVCSLR